MDQRKQKILRSVIEEYVSTGTPVGSGVIVDKYIRDVSSPTIRNDMQELERAGFITHPHTSAGRIPTEAGYRFYIEHLLPEKKVTPAQERVIAEARGDAPDVDQQMKCIAKKVAELSGEAVVIGFSPYDAYYTGLSNIFAKPEFMAQDQVVNLSVVIDHMDEVMARIGEAVDSDVTVLLGSDNPFGVMCGSVLSSAWFGRRKSIVGILGPMRMDYGRNVAFIKYIKFLLEQ